MKPQDAKKCLRKKLVKYRELSLCGLPMAAVGEVPEEILKRYSTL